ERRWMVGNRSRKPGWWLIAPEVRLLRSPRISRRCPLTAGDPALNRETAGSTPPSVTTPPASGTRSALRTQTLEVRILSGVPLSLTRTENLGDRLQSDLMQV